ncbi:hypothetical protein SASPL_111695 [Salvia splendens]|uniref:Uncharacterized protein n=1 Tax=Salvia splendens TaxID=180675 RepID=A0A8X8Y8K7_SALSN|nr:hypothetical protein SASPL_111695 [Salvia splendens]
MDATREELSDTMAVFRLSGMEIRDLIMELSDNGSAKKNFISQIDNEIQRRPDFNWRKIDLVIRSHNDIYVFFPVCANFHYYLVVYWMKKNTIEIIDNHKPHKNMDPFEKYDIDIGLMLVKSWSLPDWLVHWGHPGNMAVLLFTMGGYGIYLGFRIRFSDDIEEKAKAKDLYPKLLGGMFLFYALGATGGITSLLTSDRPIFERYICSSVYDALHALILVLFLLSSCCNGLHRSCSFDLSNAAANAV